MYNFHTERPIWECTFLQIWFSGPLNKTCFFKVSVITFKKAYFGLVKNIFSKVGYSSVDNSIYREGLCIKLSSVWKNCVVWMWYWDLLQIFLNKNENSFCLMVDHLTENLKFTSNFHPHNIEDKCKPTFFFSCYKTYLVTNHRLTYIMMWPLFVTHSHPPPTPPPWKPVFSSR